MLITNSQKQTQNQNTKQPHPKAKTATLQLSRRVHVCTCAKGNVLEHTVCSTEPLCCPSSLPLLPVKEEVLLSTVETPHLLFLPLRWRLWREKHVFPCSFFYWIPSWVFREVFADAEWQWQSQWIYLVSKEGRDLRKFCEWTFLQEGERGCCVWVLQKRSKYLKVGTNSEKKKKELFQSFCPVFSGTAGYINRSAAFSLPAISTWSNTELSRDKFSESIVGNMKMFSLEKAFTVYADPHTALKSVIEQACLNDEMATSTADTLNPSLLWKLVSHSRCHAPLGAVSSTGCNKPNWIPPKSHLSL